MKSNRIVIPGMLAAFLAVMVLQGCGGDSAESTETGPSGNQRIATVHTEKIKPENFQETIQLTGTVSSFEDVMVPAEEGGRVIAWLVPRGAVVRKGQVLVQIDSTVLRASYDAAKATYNLAQTSYVKQKKAFEQDAISELQLKTLEFQRDAAEAQMQLMKARLNKASIKSPIDGIVNERFVEAGEMSAPGLPVAHVVNLSRLKVDAGVPERNAGNFVKGDTVRFSVDALPGEEFFGRIGFVGAAVNKNNRTIPVEVLIERGSKGLKPDMIASMLVTLRSRPNSIVIPEDYLQIVNVDKFVVFIENDGMAEERQVRIAGSSRGRVKITDGLKIGDNLITLGFQNVADGQQVQVKN